MTKPKLQFIVFETTTKCNLNCKYCYNIWKRPDQKNNTNDSYIKARKTLKKLFKQAEVEQITFTGGEPLISERFFELVLFTRLKKKNVSVISNGNAGTKDDYKTLLSLGVDLFEFPVLSWDEGIHDFLTGVKGSWKKAVQSVNDVVDLGGNVVAVIVITKSNFKNIDKTLKFISDLGIKRIMLNRYNIGGSGISQPEHLVLNKDELNDAYKTANDIAKELHLRLTSNVCTPLCLLNPANYKNIGFTSCSSSIYNKPITIDIDGNMRICNHSPVIIGNIFSEKIEKILASPYIKQWVEIIPDYCNGCEIFDKCLGGCRAASEQSGLSLSHVDPILTYKSM
ncbi:MAG: radical SAM protein [Bacteroidota bacterium]